ncbi:MAG: peptidyl-prolyl cis-trans isomerase [Deltaproteobacteria bacterium]|nr:peptidyl-prolyl cis-trans isomerase [Deltaproteobacteria bacterium]
MDRTDEVEKTGTAGGEIVFFETSAGDFEVELYPEKAPVTVENFLAYVNEAFFDGLIFHRVIDGFMIQGGGFDEHMNQKQTREPIRNEAGNGLKNEKYTIAMARTNVVDSATAQFFINVEDNDFLDHRDESPEGFGYAVFGKVVRGTDVIDRIEAVKTTTKGYYENVPVDPVIIRRASVRG